MIRLVLTGLAVVLIVTPVSAQPEPAPETIRNSGLRNHDWVWDLSGEDWGYLLGTIAVVTAIVITVRVMYFQNTVRELAKVEAKNPLPNRQANCIAITAMPAGDAPPEIRQAWVGTVLPVKKCDLIPVKNQPVLAASKPEWGYVVDAMIALNHLAERSPSAAQWWITNRPDLLQAGAELVFRDVECTKIG
jgi:hypothetical protein